MNARPQLWYKFEENQSLSSTENDLKLIGPSAHNTSSKFEANATSDSSEHVGKLLIQSRSGISQM